MFFGYLIFNFSYFIHEVFSIFSAFFQEYLETFPYKCSYKFRQSSLNYSSFLFLVNSSFIFVHCYNFNLLVNSVVVNVSLPRIKDFPFLHHLVIELICWFGGKLLLIRDE